MSLEKFSTFLPQDRALIALAVLLDGHEAHAFLGIDTHDGARFSEIAKEFTGYDTDLRMPLVGTLLRKAIEDLGRHR